VSEENLPVEGAGDLFDPDNFVTKTLLNGKIAAIREAEFVRHNYGGKIAEQVTALRLRVTSDELEKQPKPILVACGDLYPSQDGKTKALAGPFLVGGKIDNRSSIATFLKNLKASGHPGINNPRGATALIDENFLWKSIEKSVSKTDTKAYDVPAEYKGKAAPEQAAVGVGADEAPAVPVGTEPQVATESSLEVAQSLREKVKAALVKFNGEIMRGQLSVRVGAELANEPQDRKMAMFALLLKDEFLASIDGVTFDKKTVKLVAEPAAETKAE